MRQTGGKTFTILLGICLVTAACSGGGGSGGIVQSASIPTNQPTPSPSPTSTGIIGALGPLIVSWKGDGAYSAQSDPNWPISFSSIPGDPLGSFTNGPPILFTAIGQSVTVSLKQTNYSGLLPSLAIFIGGCTGLSGVGNGPTQYKVTYASSGSTGCNLELDGAQNGSYQGAGALMHIVVPSGG